MQQEDLVDHHQLIQELRDQLIQEMVQEEQEVQELLAEPAVRES
jgi:hypothetical protein